MGKRCYVSVSSMLRFSARLRDGRARRRVLGPDLVISWALICRTLIVINQIEYLSSSLPWINMNGLKNKGRSCTRVGLSAWSGAQLWVVQTFARDVGSPPRPPLLIRVHHCETPPFRQVGRTRPLPTYTSSLTDYNASFPAPSSATLVRRLLPSPFPIRPQQLALPTPPALVL